MDHSVRFFLYRWILLCSCDTLEQVVGDLVFRDHFSFKATLRPMVCSVCMFVIPLMRDHVWCDFRAVSHESLCIKMPQIISSSTIVRIITCLDAAELLNAAKLVWLFLNKSPLEANSWWLEEEEEEVRPPNHMTLTGKSRELYCKTGGVFSHIITCNLTTVRILQQKCTCSNPFIWADVHQKVTDMSSMFCLHWGRLLPNLFKLLGFVLVTETASELMTLFAVHHHLCDNKLTQGSI